MTAASPLLHIHDLACQLLDALPKSEQAHTQLHSCGEVSPLGIRGPNVDVLFLELSELDVPPDLVHHLITIYQEKTSKLHATYQEAYIQTASTLQMGEDRRDDFIATFRCMLAKKYTAHTKELWNIILRKFESAKQTCRKEIHETVAGFQTSPISTETRCPSTKASRGHDSDAVRILEQAFRHTPNITQAEKYRLAEVTGLKPKQVTIWFQNRRNRKGKKGSKHERTTPSPTFAPRLPSPHTPSSPPTVDFDHSEKKRKSYGALDRCSPENTDSDSDSPASHVKKPRIPRSTSGSSKASASSEEYKPSFPGWSSPSSRSASSSSASSGQGACFDSPGRDHNVFRLLNPLKYEGRAKQCMPPVTIASPVPTMQPRMGQVEQSPFTTDNFSGLSLEAQHSSTCLPENGLIGLDFGNLDQDLGALQRELRESIQGALALSPLTPATSRNPSSSSWDSQLVATDDDGWVDEDELGAAPARPSESLVNGTAALTLPCSLPAAALPAGTHASFSQVTTDAWNAAQVPSAGGNTSLDSSHSYFCEDDCFDLNQFFESAASTTNASMMMANSPFIPHQQHSPPHLPHSTTAFATEAGGDPTASCLDFEVEMADILDYLNNPSFLAPIPDTATGGECMEEASEGAGAHFYLNFDLSSDVFSLP